MVSIPNRLKHTLNTIRKEMVKVMKSIGWFLF
jgi:hypothetical protein